MSFATQIEVSNGVLIISLKGKVLEESVLKEVLQAAEKQLGSVKGKVLLNLSELDYINSTGINFFIKLLTKARVHGGDLVLCGIKGSVKTIVHISKMDEVFTITDSQDEALTLFKSTK